MSFRPPNCVPRAITSSRSGRRTPIVAGPGDHFILRTLSPVETVGGGVIVEAVPRRLKRTRPGVLEDVLAGADAVADEARFVEYCVKTADGLAANETQLAVRAKVLRSRLQAILADLLREEWIIALSPGLFAHRDTAAAAARRLTDIVGQHHRQSPESPGLSIEQLRQESRLDKAVSDGLIALLKQQGRLVEQNQRLALPEHRPTFQDADAKNLEAIEGLFRQQAFAPPSVEELTRKTGLPPKAVEKLVGVLREHQRLVWVGEGLLIPLRGHRPGPATRDRTYPEEGASGERRFQVSAWTRRGNSPSPFWTTSTA